MIPFTNNANDAIRHTFEYAHQVVDYFSLPNAAWETVDKVFCHVMNEYIKTQFSTDWTETVGKALEHANQLLK